MRALPPPVPEDARRRAANRAHAEAQKKKKDAKEARRNKKILEREAREKRRRRQRQDSLPVELSPSPSLSEDSKDDRFERGQGPLDHLPDVGETAPGASASSPSFPGAGGDGAPWSTIAHPTSEADTPELRALGKRAVGPSGSTVVTEQAAAGATQLPPQGVKGAPESDEGRLAPVNTGAVPPPPPWSLQRRTAVPKRLQPRSR